jgi:hypothetical protein
MSQASWTLSSSDPYPAAGYQKRQFGVSTVRVTGALASPPAAMVTAESHAKSPTLPTP